MSEKLKYPIGHFKKPEKITEGILKSFIADISSFPKRIGNEVKDLSEIQLNTPYRPGGWTIKQLIHHCADSHMNSLIRFKLALTEEKPIVKPYNETLWAELPDSMQMEIEPSLKILEGVHARWTVLLSSLTVVQWESTFVHPQHGKEYRLDEYTGFYAWHCNHHLAHVTALKSTMKWP